MEKIQAWQKLTRPSSLTSSLRMDSKVSLSDISISLSRCTSCGICAVVCESAIHTASLWESMRGAIRELGFVEDMASKKSDLILRMKNPYGEYHENRNSWIPSDYKPDYKAPVALFTGCTLAYRNGERARAVLRILDASGIRYRVLDDEYCCGSYVFRTGTWKDYKDTIQEMIESIKSKGIAEILVPCAGCLKTLTLDWPRVYGKPLPFRVTSFAVFIRDKIRENLIRFESDEQDTESKVSAIIYHDPCHGGRHLMPYLGEDLAFEAPRDVILSIPHTKLLEFQQNRQFQSCCGAGGGLKSEDPEMAGKIAREKLVDAKKLGAKILVSSCPFCVRNFSDANQNHNDEDESIEVLDLIELVDRAIQIEER
jgi:heterodisulfide reductase subunit D